MKILLTSGGTRVAIDDVRSIVNFSSGQFGKRIATAGLLAGHHVTHLRNINAPSPFEFKVDLINGRHADYIQQLDGLQDFASRNFSRYSSVTFDTYDDYAHLLEERCTNFNYDAVILCAAVSDAKPVPFSGKLATESVKSIDLVPTAKLITRVREWQSHATIIGFKLTSGSSIHDIMYLARKQIRNSYVDMVVANDLQDMKEYSKFVRFVCADGTTHTVSGTSQQIAETLIEEVDRLVRS